MRDWTHKEGDTLPLLTGTIQRRNPTTGVKEVVDLTGVTSPGGIQFRMRTDEENSAFKIDAVTVTVTDAAGGRISYPWLDADVDTPGTYVGEMIVTFPSTKKQTFPNKEVFKIRITPRLSITP